MFNRLNHITNQLYKVIFVEPKFEKELGLFKEEFKVQKCYVFPVKRIIVLIEKAMSIILAANDRKNEIQMIVAMG